MEQETSRWQRRYEREKRARQQAEDLLESKSRELFESNQALKRFSEELEDLVSERTEALERARDEALASANAKSLFLANMSHELRTPMNGVLGVLQVLQQSRLSDDQARLIQTAVESGQSLLQIISDILDFTKIEAGRLVLESVPFDTRRVLESSLISVAPLAASKGLLLLIDVDPDVPETLTGDPTRLRQVLHNFLSNAIKFTPRGEVRLQAVYENSCLTARVIDEGIGLDARQVREIFEPFVQADVSTTRRFGGTGLGLSITRRLVDAMQGRLEVESEPGQGSCFSVSLPMPATDGVGRAPAALLLPGLEGIWLLEPNPSREQILSRLMAARVSADIHSFHSTEVCQRELASLLETDKDPGAHSLIIGCHEALSRLPAALRENWRTLALEPLIQDVSEVRRLRTHGHVSRPVRESELLDMIRTVWEMPVMLPPETGLPVGDAENEAPSLTAGSALPVAPAGGFFCGYRALLVDDNLVNRQVGQLLLQAMGLHVDLAEHGAEAVQAVSDEWYDILFMDVQMPVMDGHEAARRIRAKGGFYATMPIVAMTAHAMAEDREMSLTAGMSSHLTKPVDAAEVEQVLHGFLDTGFDWNGALQRLTGRRDLLEKIVVTFVRDKSAAPRNLHEALENGQINTARGIAHSLKGGAATVGAVALSEVAANIEQACKRGEAGEALQLYPDLNSRFRQLRELTEAWTVVSDSGKEQSRGSATCFPEDKAIPMQVKAFLSTLDKDLGLAQTELEKLAKMAEGQDVFNQLQAAFTAFEMDEARALAERWLQAVSGSLDGAPEGKA